MYIHVKILAIFTLCTAQGIQTIINRLGLKKFQLFYFVNENNLEVVHYQSIMYIVYLHDIYRVFFRK